MKNIELEKVYSPKSFEERIYNELKDKGYYNPDNQRDTNGKTFTIVMPPPNVTGILHMGHALNNSLQDIIIRYKRALGFKALWLPGTDHAGIATQHVVEVELEKEGKHRKDMTRDEFLKKTWSVKDRHHDIIKKQLEKIASSCDWSRERFTMDEGLSKAVRECFVTLYERGLIYKGEYLVNYCPHCGTALSDDEVDYSNVDSFIWDIRYPLEDGSGYVTVSTTRPETMFGDVAVAVNPKDERYKDLVGKKLILPLVGRKIEIVQDSFVDLEFGTGAVKITPAHDPNDYACAERHNLEKINILNPDGTLNSNVPKEYQNLDVESARKKVAHELKEKGFLISEKPLSHEVGHCYRCGTTIEPYLSKQWFVKMDGMAQKALDALKKGDIKFYPEKWESTYIHWMKNIRPWCISRQLWWGHRIPAWTCSDCGEVIVTREDPTKCPHCGGTHLKQDEDVLDTWFSSWLWPFSTLGWPQNTKDLETFFPTNALITAYDIIFFWVSRMIMASLEFRGEVPFKDIYITSLVRDKKGRKMSKSLGNGIDPIEVVNEYGSDAMKFTLGFMASQGQDIQIDMNSFKLGSKFCNKVWNASRYLLMNLDGKELQDVSKIEKNTWSKWLYSRLNRTIKVMRDSFDSYKINDAASAIYSFFWNDFCSVYIERSKLFLESTDKKVVNETISILLDVLHKTLILMNPIVPLVTEEIYASLPNKKCNYLIEEHYPEADENAIDKSAEESVELLEKIITSIRSLKATLGINEGEKTSAIISVTLNDSARAFVESEKEYILKTSYLDSLTFKDARAEKGYVFTGEMGYECSIKVPSTIDVTERVRKLEKQKSKLEESLDATKRKLSNPSFVERASSEAQEKERGKEKEFEEELSKTEAALKILREWK